MSILLCTSEKLDSYLRPRLRFDVEEVWAVALTSNLSLISGEMIFRGHAAGCFVHAREIYRFAIRENAVHLAIAHSHPSGDHEASPADLKLTKDLHEIGKWLKIPLIEHLILSKNGYFSMNDRGYFEHWRKQRNNRSYLKSSN
ncbi:MAG TPA: JAB domain-containing protein [Pseudobdellovibrionaceae bacterium]|nr:JAB domain-containing protein [Pseudobdellovibrionaceae bacterium]